MVPLGKHLHRVDARQQDPPELALLRSLEAHVAPVDLEKLMGFQSAIARAISSHWQKSQVRRFSEYCSADFGPRLPTNKLQNNQKIDKLETFASDCLSP